MSKLGRANVEAIYPLSPLQEGMLFHSLYEPGSGLYVNRFACRLAGADPRALRGAWERLVARHPILRTTFLWQELERPLQVVHREVELPWRDLDWTDAEPSDENDEAGDGWRRRAGDLLAGDDFSSFGLARPPLQRLACARLAGGDLAMVWSHHHILLDGWSLGLLLAELLALHDDLAAGREPSLPPARGFGDFISWLERRDDSDAEATWRRHLEGFAAATALPLDRRAGAGAPELAVVERVLPPAATGELEALVRRHRLTLSSLVQAAWGLLLARHAGGEDVAFGVTVAGRPTELPGAERIAGLFINTLPVRLAVPAGETVGRWLTQVQERLVELRRHEHLPLVRVQGWSEVAAGDPLFESVVVFENYPGADEAGQPGGATVAEVLSAESTHYPLTLQAGTVEAGAEGGAGTRLALKLAHDRRRVDDAAAAVLVDQLSTLLAAMAADDGARLADLPLTPPAELAAATAGWNATARPYAVETTLSARIEAQTKATPEAPALGFAAEGAETAWWSYRELDERTNRLARHLCGLGVGPETRVGVAVERSHELVATLVAVHKAGGAYVPLDPDYPAERLAFMAADAGLALLVTQQHLVDGLPEVDAPLLAVDAAWDEIGEESAEPLAPLAGPDSLAYAIYTSGSTGRPKGAMLAHRGVVNRLDWMQEAFGIAEGDVVLQKTPASFDVSVWELFWPLMTGAALLVAPPGAHRDGERLAAFVRDGGVTTMHFVPSMLRAFLAAPGVEECTGLRRVVASGEALPPDLVESFNAALPAAALHNLYGPTEASVDVTWWACPRDGAVDRVPIGAPIANTAVHVLDADKRPLPVGVGGELHLAGVQLARGYLGRPALTAERFVPDPLSGSSNDRQPGGRLYRTGDLARWLPDGNVEYLGRLDHQVKVRGVRIELGEIEAALAALPAVREAAVLARTDDGSEARLVGYLVAADTASPPTVEELRTALAARLPEAYLPSAWVVLDEMPLSPAGKLDRRALPAPSGDRPELGGEYVAPRNDTEEGLAAAWARGLGVDEVGIDDDFFALGGDSIRSIRVLGLVRKLGHELELRDLLDHPTVRRLARAVAAGEAGGRGGELIGEPFSLAAAADRERLPDGVEDAYPLTRLQSGMLFHTRLSPELPVYHDVFSLRLRARFDRASLAGALAAAVVRHPVLRTSFALAGYSEPLQLVHREAEVPLAVDDLRDRPETDRDAAVAAWMEAEKATPFDWTAAPLLRVQVHRRDADTFQLSLAFHHAVLDGWSVATLVTGLLGDYLARLDGTGASEADAPAVAFRDFVALERAALASEESRRFWVDGLAGRERTTLPRWPRAEHASGTRLHPVPLGSDLSAALKRLARQAGVPVKTVLLAAHLRVLAYVCGGDRGARASVTSGLVTTGRPESEGAESLLGLFLNTLPLAVDLPAGSWLDLVAATFTAERAALPHRRFPLAEVQRLAGGDDLFEAAFLFVHFHVYDRLRGRSDLAIEGGEFFESTNIPLLANFGVELGRGDDSGGDSSGGNLHLDLVYDAAELAAPQVVALAGRYRRALAAMTAEPKSPWAAADLLGDDERRRLLAWSTDGAQAAPPRRLDERFAATAAALPEKTALVVGEERWSYRELTRRVDRLAERLRTEGVGSGTLVGVCLERDGRLPVALLAVMAAGGAYVPLDPDYPADRVAFILDDAAAPLLVASEATAVALPADTRTLLLDAAGAVAAVRGRRTAPAAAGVEPQAGDLAYVIYTSGSTGRPKGVAIEHASASAMVEWALQTYGAAELAGVLASTSVCFDLSVYELFVPLAAGGKVILAADALELPRLPAADEVTLVNTVPSAAAELVRGGALPPRVETVNLAGEPLLRSLADAVHACPGVERLYNLYGPSEDTTYSTWARIDRGDGKPPIGRPLAASSAHVLDPALGLAPAGSTGELYLAGAGVARGYLGRPALTAERFLPDPYAGGSDHPVPGARMYRTGDLVRWLPTGEAGEGDAAPGLEYLGRADQQVKVRGFRIELGEIEQALVRCEGVREAAVAAPVTADGGRRLVGYVAGDGLEAAALRRELGGWLPPHMVPGTFVVLDALPRTPNGKLDRRALPAAEESARLARAPYTAPRTPAEEAIAAAFEQALELGEVGIDDDFLALGGDSIRTLRAVAVGRELGVELSVEALLSGKSVRELAQAAASAPSAANENLRPEPFALVPPGDRLLLAELPAAERDALEDAYPLTRLQLGMFFHAEQRPGSALYHEIFDLHAAFRFDAAALARALATVVARHPVLRTAFDGARFGEPLQLVHRRAAMPFAVVDLRGLPEGERDAAVEAAKRRELAAPLDRSRAPLARLRVCRLDEREARLLFSFHHAVLDGWSAAVMVGELLRAYARDIGEEALPLGEPPGRAFAEFVALERRALGDDAVRELWSREAAAGGAAPLPRWPRRKSEGGEPRVELTEIAFGDDISDAVKAFARRTGVPLKSALLAAHLRVLAEVGDRRVASTGLVTNGRPETADGESALGLFLNTLPFRLDVSGSWAELARRAHRRELELLPGRRFPLAEIQRQAGGEPLFDTLFSFLHLHVHRGVAELPGIEMLGGGLTEATNFPFVATFGLDPESRRLYLELRCDAGELAAGQVEQLAGFYRAALGRIAAAPDSPVRWPLVGEAERERNAGWNETARPYAVETTLSARIEAQAAATPEAPALGFAAEGAETAWWSYRELDERTNRLARHLRGLGVGPETRVGVAVERSHELVATLVAVHKAGGAYVPLDPDYPSERLAFMAADAGLALLVTQEHLVEGLPEVDAPLLAVDAAWNEIAEESAEPLAPLAGPDSLAYAIYTSGSTGRPKGAMLAHRGVVNRLDWMQEAFGIGEGDVVLQKTPASFDVSVWEFFWPLMTGAALLVAPPGAHRDGERLAGIVRDGGVTTMHFVPSMLRAFLAAPGVEGCTGLRRVVASGEALPPDLVESFNAALPGAELHNLYGPTEASVDVTWWACPRDGAIGRVPIGAPIANTAVHVLDGDMRPLPVGVGGELHLAGVQLARGYLGRPALTAERFVPDPLSGSSKGRQPGGRLYRTGDLARWLPDGNVEYLGRLDHQVKVRGVRIELGEIEAALNALPAVREAAVLARSDDGPEALLVGYLVPEDTASPPTVEELLTALAARLPEAYLPSAWVVLDEMPLSPAGKLDRRALPAPSGDRPELGGEYVAPRNDTERRVAEIWAQVLKVERVGVEDDLFALGGHSLLAVQLVVRLRAVFGVDLPQSALYETPTVAGLSLTVLALEQAAGDDDDGFESLLAEIEGLSDEEIARQLGDGLFEEETA